jgi:hypothetical protein
LSRKPLLMISASLLVLGITLFLFCRLSPWYLTIYTPKDGQVLHRLPLKTGDTFALRYTHSVTNREVTGTFTITADGQILPLTTTFDTFGPGLPYLDGSLPYVREGDAYIVYHEEEPREKISLFVSSLTRERLIWKTGELDLSAFQEEPLLIHIYAEKHRY